jgi:hypothetical protein
VFSLLTSRPECSIHLSPSPWVILPPHSLSFYQFTNKLFGEEYKLWSSSKFNTTITRETNNDMWYQSAYCSLSLSARKWKWLRMQLWNMLQDKLLSQWFLLSVSNNLRLEFLLNTI